MYNLQERMTSLSSDSCFSGGNLCRRLDITDVDDIVSHVPAEAAVSLGPFVVALQAGSVVALKGELGHFQSKGRLIE